MVQRVGHRSEQVSRATRRLLDVVISPIQIVQLDLRLGNEIVLKLLRRCG